MKLKICVISLALMLALLPVSLFSSCGLFDLKMERLNEPVVLSDEHGTRCTVVTPERATNTVLDCVERMNALAAGENAPLPVLPLETDTASTGEGRLEILVGKTNRAETKAVMEELAYGDWAVVLRGEKIVVVAHTRESLCAATAVLREELLRVEEDDNGGKRLVFVANCYYESGEDLLFTSQNPLSGYQIVCSSDTRAAAECLREEIKRVLGFDLPVIDAATGEREHEIVVGDIDRDICEEIEDSDLNAISYVLLAEDGKLLIGAPNNRILDAVSAFCHTYLENRYSDAVNFVEDHRSIEVAYVFQDGREEAPGSNIRVMSFNVLCELWDAAAVDYYTRANTAVAVIKKFLPDVVGLQEMSDSYHTAVTALFGEDYKIVDAKNEAGETNFSPLAYNTERVKLKRHGTKIFSSGDNTKLRLASWAVFEDRESGKRFAVVNTHWDLGEHRAYQMTQAAEMGDLVNWLREKYECPVITTGDYNARESEEPYQLYVKCAALSEASRTARRVGRVGHTVHLLGNPPLADSTRAIDHIFGTGDVEFLYYNLLVDQSILAASDHCPIYADVRLK